MLEMDEEENWGSRNSLGFYAPWLLFSSFYYKEHEDWYAAGSVDLSPMCEDGCLAWGAGKKMGGNSLVRISVRLALLTPSPERAKLEVTECETLILPVFGKGSLEIHVLMLKLQWILSSEPYARVCCLAVGSHARVIRSHKEGHTFWCPTSKTALYLSSRFPSWSLCR